MEQAGLTDDEVEQVVRWLPEFGRVPVGHPTLCHGDLNTEHVFVDDQLRVSGMIDWGMWCGGSLIMELATMACTLKARMAST